MRSMPHSLLPSATSTPAPASLSEQLSIASSSRPFKSPDFQARMAKISSNLSRRNKSLKQILINEREAALRANGVKLRRKAEKNKGKLTGAAAKAWRKREEREKKVEPEEEEVVDLTKPKREVPTYASVEAPPSLRPRKKYCDVTGLIAPYTDPKSRLRYHSVQVYDIIKQFGPGVDNAYLSLRGDASEIK